jgi:spore germination protein GerM
MKRRVKLPAFKKTNYPLIAVAVLGGLFILAWLFNFLPARPGENYPAVRAYFFKGDRLAAVERRLSPDQSPLKQALEETLAGPTAHEMDAGFTTQIPPAVKLRGVSVKGRVAIIDLSHELEDYGGGSARVEGIVAQLVYTATEIPGVDKAWLWIEGQGKVVLGGEGLVLDHPLSRLDVKY